MPVAGPVVRRTAGSLTADYELLPHERLVVDPLPDGGWLVGLRRHRPDGHDVGRQEHCGKDGSNAAEWTARGTAPDGDPSDHGRCDQDEEAEIRDHVADVDP